jgi:iron complex outermembrane receptor protein
VRSPSRLDRDVFLPGSPPFSLVANDTFESEVANVYELGYRSQATPALSYSMTLFHHDFDRLRSILPQAGGAVFANDIEGYTSGIEAWGSWRVLPTWLITAGMMALRERLHVKSGALDIGGVAALGNDPAVQWMARTEIELTPQHLMSLSVRHVGALPQPSVPAYTAVDAWLSWKATRAFELSLVARNLTDPQHVEWGASPNRAEFGRSFFIKALWTY